MRNPALSLLNRLHTTSTSTTARIRFLRPAVVRKEISPTKILFSQYYHQGSAPTSPFSINKLREMIHASSSSASYYPSQLVSLIDESADQERQSNLSDEMYNKVTHEMMSFMLNVTNSPNGLVEDEDRMGGEGVYKPEVLDMYDALVWGFNSPFLWRITEDDIRSLYKANISQHHCEIGVGTGLFLSKDVSQKCKSITLIDLNENSLQSCEKRIHDTYLDSMGGDDIENNISTPDVSKVVADMMIPMEKESSLAPLKGNFQSVGANFLFHCLHGSNLHDKIVAFRNCASLLDPENGVFYGSTILGKDMLDDQTDAGEIAMQVLNNFNESGVFGNFGDSMEELEDLLKEIFVDVEVWRIGYCGVWVARNPK